MSKPAPKKTETAPIKPPKPELVKAETKGRPPPPKKDEKADEEEDDQDEDDGEDAMKKGLDSAALMEGLKTLEAAAKTPRTRKDELLQKATAGEKLSQEERQELDQALSGGGLRESIAEDDVLSKAIEIAPALDVLTDKVSASLDALRSDFTKSVGADVEFRGALAKSVVEIGELVGGMATALGSVLDRLTAIEKQPAGAPRSVGTSLEKGQGAAAGLEPGQGEGKLSHKEATLVMEQMFYKSVQDGRGGVSLRGTNITNAMGRWMATKEIEPAFAKEVIDFYKSTKSA